MSDTSPTPMPVPLPQATPDFRVRVQSVTGDCDDAARLQAMGVCVGRRVMLVQSGDPLIVRVAGSRIGISARLAEQVQVMPVCDSDPSPPEA